MSKGQVLTVPPKNLPCLHSIISISVDGNFIFPGSVQFSRSVMSDSLRPHGQQHTRPPCPSPTPRVYPNSSSSSQWCHPTSSSSVGPFSSRLQSFPASRSFPISQLFTSGGQSIRVSASVLSMNIQDWFPLGWTGWISFLSKGLSRVFSNTTVQKHQLTSHLKPKEIKPNVLLRKHNKDPSLMSNSMLFPRRCKIFMHSCPFDLSISTEFSS